jgi:hypothetical protein
VASAHLREVVTKRKRSPSVMTQMDGVSAQSRSHGKAPEVTLYAFHAASCIPLIKPYSHTFSLGHHRFLPPLKRNLSFYNLSQKNQNIHPC